MTPMYEDYDDGSRSDVASNAEIESFNDYYDRCNELVEDADWESSEILAELLSCREKHATLPFLRIFDIDDDYPKRNIISNIFDDFIGLHCRVLFHLGRQEFEDAFATQTMLLQHYNKELLSKEKDANWFIPILYTLCNDLRVIGSMADKHREIVYEDEKSFYEEAANSIMEDYRICVAEGRNAVDITKKVAILNLTNQLFRIYFRLNRLHLLKPLIRAIENAEELHKYFSKPDLVTYNYFVGRKSILDNDLAVAEKSLSFAFDNCPSEATENKRRILIYLIPIKMFFGHMPTQNMLDTHDLSCFQELVFAVKEGNVKRFEKVMEHQEDFFIDSGIYLLIEKLRMTTFLNLVKAVHKITNAHQIKLDAILAVLKNTGVDVHIDELGCILANLIVQKKMKGYVSYVHQTLVLSKVEPFPHALK
ncbi:CSN12-like protein [Aphelenchoides bicaudatus]|nr:CSN12-like protein [Aphelenchoides bicaudatus]